MQIAQRLFQGVDTGDGEMEASSPTTAPTRRRSRTRRCNESARVISEMFGGEYYDGAAPLPDPREERAGSARSHPPGRLPPGAEPARTRARPRRLQGLRPDLEARRWRRRWWTRACCAPRSRSRPRAPAATWPCSPPAARRSSSPASAAPTSRAATIRPPSSRSRRRSCRSARSATASTREGTADHAARHRAEAPRDHAAGALHRGVAHQGAGAARHRPAVHLRADDRHHRAPRLRVPPEQGARAQLHGVCRHQAAARPLRRLRRDRLHRRDGGGPRRDLARRARVDRRSSRSSTTATRSIAGC